jgi:hypothetical protein
LNERESGFQPYTAYSQSVLAAAAIASLTIARTVLLHEAAAAPSATRAAAAGRDTRRHCYATTSAFALLQRQL